MAEQFKASVLNLLEGSCSNPARDNNNMVIISKMETLCDPAVKSMSHFDCNYWTVILAGAEPLTKKAVPHIAKLESEA